MEKLLIKGGTPLTGEVCISGAKNAAVAIIPACIIANGVCRLENLPDIKDVTLMIDILSQLGAGINYIDNHTVIIDTSTIKTTVAPYEMVCKMRGSSYLIGALLARFGKASVAMPGGCYFGSRPIDQHIKGFEALGAKVDTSHGVVTAEAESLKGAHIYMDVVSVGATINVMLAATVSEGITIIDNAAKEPHIVDVANFLNTMGANIKGAGTDVIRINGVKNFTGCTYSVIQDQIEAGTFMVAAAATKGDVLVKNVIPKHMEAISAKLMEMGVCVEEFDDSIRVKWEKPIKSINLKTLPYPGFPTDMQPQIVTLLSMAEGTSVVTESVWDNRFQYIDELKRLGASVQVSGKMAVVQGVEKLTGSPVMATDLRAGAAMVIAGLAAEGCTEVEGLNHIDRGYENFEQKLVSLGADIKRVSVVE